MTDIPTGYFILWTWSSVLFGAGVTAIILRLLELGSTKQVTGIKSEFDKKGKIKHEKRDSSLISEFPIHEPRKEKWLEDLEKFFDKKAQQHSTSKELPPSVTDELYGHTRDRAAGAQNVGKNKYVEHAMEAVDDALKLAVDLGLTSQEFARRTRDNIDKRLSEFGRRAASDADIYRGARKIAGDMYQLFTGKGGKDRESVERRAGWAALTYLIGKNIAKNLRYDR